jgi:DNA-binding NarL/FixJ family response regulator
MSGLDVLRALHSSRAPLRAIVLAGNIRKSEVLHSVQLGVHGVVLKDAPTEMLFAAILSVLAGRHWLDQRLVGSLMEMVRALDAPANGAPPRRPFGLTRRELEVLALVVAGYPNKEIALACQVSEETVKHHLTRMFDKVGASNRLELAMIATESGLVSESPPGGASTQPA